MHTHQPGHEDLQTVLNHVLIQANLAVQLEGQEYPTIRLEILHIHLQNLQSKAFSVVPSIT